MTFHRIGRALLAAPLVAALASPGQAGAEIVFSPSEASPFGLSGNPASVAIGDLDRDGNPDLATANAFPSNNISVLLGNGAGGFSEAAGSPLRVARFPMEIAIGDVNRDRNLDLATANTGAASVSVRLGDGAGGFTRPRGDPFAVGDAPRSIAIGDLDRDGNPDLATANVSSDDVTLLLGDGAAGFAEAAASPFPAGDGAHSIAIGNFDRRGGPDLAIANDFSDDVTVLLGDGAGGFAEPAGSPFGVGQSAGEIVRGDLNLDGNVDLAIANSGSENSVTVLLGNGTGEFAEAQGSPFGAGTGSEIAVGDLDLDGNPDLATSNSLSDDATVLLGNGDGEFAEAARSPFAVRGSPTSIAIRDLDSDARPDLAVTNSSGAQVSPSLTGGSGVTVLLNKVCTITGTPENDVLTGTPGEDVICAGEGNDLLVGDDGNDVLLGDGGDDELLGRKGYDVLEGGGGDDLLVGFRGNDFLDGGPGVDRLSLASGASGGADLNLATGWAITPGLGTDRIALDDAGSTVEHADGARFGDRFRGDGQDNRLNGAGGADSLTGGSGDDLLVGMGDGDRLRGADGNDELKPGPGDDSTILGGDGSDTVRYDDITGGGVMVDLAAGIVSPLGGSNSGHDNLGIQGDRDVENATGSPAPDVLSAVIAGTASLLEGENGDDSLETADGDSLDIARGGPGVDSCATDAGDDEISC